MINFIRSLTVCICMSVCVMTNVIAQSLDLEEVDAELCIIMDNDQQIRTKLNSADSRNQSDRLLISSEMDSIDLHNQKYVANLLDNYGWPDNLSEKANNAIWYVIDHAALTFMEKYFHLVKEKGMQGVLNMVFIATMEDRILMYSYKKQKYGTQSVNFVSKEGEYVTYLWPIEDNDKVHELRASVDLAPIERYLQILENYGNKVIWDKDLQVSDINVKFR